VGGSGGFDSMDTSILHLAWTQSVAPQDEGPESWLLNGAAGQVAERLTAELNSVISLSDPVHSISQNNNRVTVHYGDANSLNAKQRLWLSHPRYANELPPRRIYQQKHVLSCNAALWAR